MSILAELQFCKNFYILTYRHGKSIITRCLLCHLFETSSAVLLKEQQLNWFHTMEDVPTHASTPILQDETDRYQNQNILQKTLLKLIPCWPELRNDECHFLSLKLSMLCYALMNSIVPQTNQMLALLEQLTP